MSQGRMISENALKTLLKQDENYTSKADGINGSKREMIANAVEKKNLNKKAYAMLKRSRKMEAEEAALVHRSYLNYLDMSGEQKRLDGVQELPMEGDVEKPMEGSGNVRHLRAAE